MLDEFESSARLLPPEEVKAKEQEVVQQSLALLPAEGNAEVQLLLELSPAEEEQTVPASLALAPAEEKLAMLPGPELDPVEHKVALPAAELPAVEDLRTEQPAQELSPVEEKVVLPTPELPPVEKRAAVALPVPELPPSPGKIKVRSSLAGKPDRPFRVKLRGSVLVLVRLPNKRSVRAAFHQLSTSGGVIHFDKPLDEKLVVELIFHIEKATIRSKAQLLFPMWATQGWMQPFRFVELPEASRELLDTNLKTFLGEASKSAAAGS